MTEDDGDRRCICRVDRGACRSIVLIECTFTDGLGRERSSIDTSRTIAAVTHNLIRSRAHKRMILAYSNTLGIQRV
jgi:hypothetical protein